MNHAQFKNLPTIDATGRVTGTRTAIIDTAQLAIDQAAAVASAGLAPPAMPMPTQAIQAPAQRRADASDEDKAEYEAELAAHAKAVALAQQAAADAQATYAAAMQDYTAQADAVRAAVPAVYHLPAGCVDVALPTGANLDDDIIIIKDGKADVQKGAARVARDALAKAAADAADKARGAADKAAAASAKVAARANALADTDWLVTRHTGQAAATNAKQMAALVAKGKALSAAQFVELETYRQALRDTDPSAGVLPAKPAFVVAVRGGV